MSTILSLSGTALVSLSPTYTVKTHFSNIAPGTINGGNTGGTSIIKHLINFESYTVEMIEQIINRAIKIKNDPIKYANILHGKKMYMLFQKTSTRTALSFWMGMHDLGGAFFSQNWQDSNFAVADICDEVRYVGRNVDIIMARLKEHQDIAEMA